MSAYTELVGGHLTPGYEILPSEDWSNGAGTTGVAALTVTPKYQGTRSLGITSNTAGTTLVSSPMEVDLTEFDGVGMPTYASAGSPLIVVTGRLITGDPAEVLDVAFTAINTATVGGEACLRLTIIGTAPAAFGSVSTGCEAVMHGSALGIDRTFTVQSITPGPTAADTYLFVRDAGVAVTPGATTGRVRVYNDDAVYYKMTWAVAAASGSGLFVYGGALYDVAVYGLDTPIDLSAWNVATLTKEQLTAVHTPTWGVFQRVDLECIFDGPGTFYLDGIAGWTRREVDASANQFVSNLPEYHHFQPFTDAFAEAVGYELDVAAASVDAGLRQRVLPDATYDLLLHEQAMSLPQLPLLRSADARRRELMGYLSMPATVAEMTATLTSIMGSAVTLVENFDAMSVDVLFNSGGNATEEARLQRACARLLPAHLGTEFFFDGEAVILATRDAGNLDDANATVT